MKIFILLTVLAANSLLTIINCEEEEDNFRFELLSPSGFRHSFHPSFDVHNITLHGVINEKKTAKVVGRYNGRTERHNNGWYVYKDTRVPVKPGDTLYYWVKINTLNSSYSTAIERYNIPANASRVSC